MMNTKLQSIFCSFLLLGCFACVAAQQLATAQPEASKTGSIKGRVLSDDGQPMANIPVTAIPIGRNLTRRQAAAPAQPVGGGQGGRIAQAVQTVQTVQSIQPIAPAQVITDDDGNFEFINLPPANYAISAAAPGYVSPLPEDDEDEDGTRSNLYRLGDVATITLVKGGVITGKILNANNEPLTGVTVSAVRIGNLRGEPDELSAARGFARGWRTDDRGVYRIYGLNPGTYIVQAGQLGQGNRGPGPGAMLSPFANDAPTYYPSSSRDAAIPLPVHAGSELTGIDIRYRGERGRSVGGKVIIAQTAKPTNQTNQPNAPTNFGATEIRLPEVRLYAAGTDSVLATTFQNERANSGFAFYNIPDGEYEIFARRPGTAGESDSVSERRPVSVRGADVSGIQLSLTPLALLSGKVLLEKPVACPSPRRSFLEEIFLAAQRETATSSNRTPVPQSTVAMPNGEFTLRNLEAGRWRLQARLPDENWFIRSIKPMATTVTATPRRTTTAATPLANFGQTGIQLKSGEKLINVIVTLAEGAAGLKGTITNAKGKQQIHLIPAEKENADDVLRYAQTNVTGEGAFQFKHIAPGRYFVLAKPANDDSAKLAWDAAARAALRKEAEAAGNIVELAACQRVNDFKLTIK